MRNSNSQSTPPLLLDRAGPIRVAFVGKLSPGVPGDPDESAKTALAAVEGAVADVPSRVLTNRQVHSDRVVVATEARREADGLVLDCARSLDSHTSALCVFTADCVPVLVADPRRGLAAALHAGWRGLASGIIEQGVARMASLERRASLTAWIGPSIGGCCYEVSAEVAVAVAERSRAGVMIQPASERPSEVKPCLHLVAAASAQLEALGVLDIRRLGGCTRCDQNWHSYRREGAGQGRNHAFIWLGGP